MPETVALTRPPGEDPGDLFLAHGTIRYAPRYPVEIVDRIGAGDSFVAGLIHGLLDGDLDPLIQAYLQWDLGGQGGAAA